ncbi:MAG TPA: hypothetical protein EYP30_06945 [Archaeoglobaceae archaeon]|nr:hypothetical protein [Archaeoglobaceae archaeon]
MKWVTRYYLLFFLIGVVSAIGLPVGDFLSPLEAGSEFFAPFLLWLFLLSLTLLLKNPKSLGMALPISILMFAVNCYPFFSGSPLFTGTQFVYIPVLLFSPIFSPLPPIFPLFLLALSFFQKNKDISFALKAVAISYIGLSAILAIFWWHTALMSYPDYI